MGYYVVTDVRTFDVLCLSIPVVSIEFGTSDPVRYLIENDSQCMHNTCDVILALPSTLHP